MRPAIADCPRLWYNRPRYKDSAGNRRRGCMEQAKPRYFIVESTVLPEIYLKVAEAKRLLETGEERTVNAAARRSGGRADTASHSPS